MGGRVEQKKLRRPGKMLGTSSSLWIVIARDSTLLALWLRATVGIRAHADACNTA
jgi:hypothetical protein